MYEPVKEVSDTLQEKWQKVIDKLAEEYNVPCAAITRLRRLSCWYCLATASRERASILK